MSGHSSVGQSLTAYYQGLSHDIPVKTGQKVKKGDVIGYSGYMKCFFDEPAIHRYAGKVHVLTDRGTFSAAGRRRGQVAR